MMFWSYCTLLMEIDVPTNIWLITLIWLFTMALSHVQLWCPCKFFFDKIWCYRRYLLEKTWCPFPFKIMISHDKIEDGGPSMFNIDVPSATLLTKFGVPTYIWPSKFDVFSRAKFRCSAAFPTMFNYNVLAYTFLTKFGISTNNYELERQTFLTK